MKILVKNLICPCCAAYVSDALNELEIEHMHVSLQGIVLATAPAEDKLKELDVRLQLAGLELCWELNKVQTHQTQS